jgi:two-component system, NtrC family, sensor kinase
VGKGTGLGLSISYQIIVEKHGGSLRCHSDLGQGTSFYIELSKVLDVDYKDKELIEFATLRES